MAGNSEKNLRFLCNKVELIRAEEREVANGFYNGDEEPPWLKIQHNVIM